MDNVIDRTIIEKNSNFFGISVSTAGDVNNDGYDDVIVGAPGESIDPPCYVYLYFGGSEMDNISDVDFVSYDKGDFGWSVSSAGDVNNDGFDDIIIGAPWEENKGRAFIYLGGNIMDNVSDMNFTADSPNDHLGNSVSGEGDVNGDGYDDVIVGAYGNDAGGDSAGRTYVYTCHVANLTGILNPGISIGSKNIWKETGYFNKTATLSDFAGEINAYLSSAAISGKDSYGNAYVDVPVNVNASGGGKLTLLNLGVTYSYTASVPDFGAILNDYLFSHKSDKNANGNINVPVKIHSQSAGRIKLSGLDLTPDKPPALVKEIGTVEINEDSWNSSLIDFYPYFKDDIDPDTLLNFQVVSSTNSTFVTVGIRNNRYLAADAMTGDANDNWTGTVEVVVACSDHWGQKTESNKFTIIVKNVNDDPIITSTPITVAEAGVTYFYNVTAIDGDNEALQFSLSKAPPNMTIDDKTGKIQWLPKERGSFQVSVIVSDGIATAGQDFTISVPNKAPRITSQPLLNATTGIRYAYTVTAEDDNLDPLTYSLVSKIEGMTIDSNNGTIVWIPQNVGSVDVVVQVSDGKAKASQDFAIKVVQANRAPKFVSKPITSATVDAAYSYGAKATDMDGDLLDYTLDASPDGMVIDSATGKVDWTPSTSGNFTVKIKVEDGRSGDTVQEFVIKVADKVRPSVLITRPAENEKMKGKTSFTGTTVKGTLEVANVQVRLDNGDWANATGIYTWQYDLDTTKLKNGKHKLEARAFDGKDYSDIVGRQFTVDNQKAAAKGFIPGFTVIGVVLALAVGSFVLLRKRECKRDGAR